MNRAIMRPVKLFSLLFFLSTMNSCLLIQAQKMTGNNTGQLKSYNYNYQKKEVNAAMQNLFNKYPQYKPASKYQNDMIHNYPDLSSPESREINADTVQFHFYLKTQKGEDILFWTRFDGIQKNWETKPCELALKGYDNGDRLYTKKNFGFFKPTWADRKIKLFEKEILPKIQIELDKLNR